MRVFTLALAAGQMVNTDSVGSVGVVLLGLAIVGVACSATELHRTRNRSPWVCVAEGIMVSLLIGNAGDSVAPLLVYLAVPAVVAGISCGRLATTNTSLAAMLTLCATEAASEQGNGLLTAVTTALPWLVIGLGAGLLAAAQTRSLRRLEASHAPYAAAHRLVGQLHTLVRELPMALDVSTHARAIQDCARSAAGASRSAVLVRTTGDTLESLVTHGSLFSEDEGAARACLASGRIQRWSGTLAFPLRVGDHVFGAAIVEGASPLVDEQLASVQGQVDEHAIRLETALLIEDVRSVATTEERNRLAREIHDGVAQRIVSLGYLADDIAALCGSSVAQQATDNLRNEITGLIGDLRFSVFDLRHDVDEAGSLSGALSEYARELSSHSDLRVHLTLDERDERLSRRAESEVLRIAQEAICNVHKHARAINVWVSLTVNGTDVRLVVEDDGIGGASLRAGHYGLHTMRERAERIDADLEVGTRHDGGTVVALRSRPSATDTMGAPGNDQRLAHR